MRVKGFFVLVMLSVLLGSVSSYAAVGDSCTEPFIVNIPADLPYNLADTTCGRVNDYSSTCMGYYDGGEDAVFQLNVTADINITIQSLGGDTYAGIALDDSCPFDASTCLATAITTSNPDIIQYSLTVGTYYLMIDIWPTPNCDTFDLTIEASPEWCPADTILGHDPDLVSWGGAISDVETGLILFDNFDELTGPICDLHWYGIQAYNSGSWVECSEDPMDFQIRFYTDDGSGMPDTGNVVCSQDVTLNAVDTGSTLGGYILYEFSLDPVTPCCPISNGWLSIQGVNGANCWFLWAYSNSGDLIDNIAYRYDGATWEQTAQDYSFCLTTTTSLVPELYVAPNPYNFGNQLVGTPSAAQTFTLTNVGTGTLTIDPSGTNPPSITGVDAADFILTDLNTYPNALGSGNSITVDIVFQPASAGAKTAYLTVVDDATKATTNIPLSGTGAIPTFQCTPDPYNFGSVEVGTDSTSQTFTLANSGAGVLTIDPSGTNPPVITGTDAADFLLTDTNTYPAALPPSITVSIIFHPTTAGAKSAFLTVVDDMTKATHNIPLSGLGDPYCASTYTNTTDDWITNVTFNTINNTTGQEGALSYGNYTALSTSVEQGLTYTLSVTFDSGGYTQHVWAWFDWNQDNVFDTGTNEAYDLGQGADATLTTDITVPLTATLGTTRFRVIEQYNSDPTPCNPHSTTYGETEDYSVNITQATGPGPPTDPVPADEAVGVAIDNIPTISWTNPAVTFRCNTVYFSTDFNLVDTLDASAIVAQGCVAPITIFTEWTSPANLANGTWYYWRIVETRVGGSTVGPVWSFRTVYTVPANDECVNAQSVTGPYPQTLTGTTNGATIDCPGILDWRAVWYAVSLPNAVNHLNISYCGTQDMDTGGIVYYNACNDCPNYTLADTYGWVTCPTPDPAALEMAFYCIPGPTTIYFPAFVEDVDGETMDFTITFNVTAAAIGDCCATAATAVVGLNSAPAQPYWYTYTATGNGSLNITSCVTGQTINTDLYVYDACGGNLVASNNDDSGCAASTLASTVEFNSLMGTSYKIYWADTSSTAAFDWTLTEYFPSNPPACAMTPTPADLATMVSETTNLSWVSGGGEPEVGYLVSLWWDDADKAPHYICQNRDVGLATTYDPSLDGVDALTWSEVYYWTIVPYNDQGQATGCATWSFTVMTDPTIAVFPWLESFGTPTCAIPYGWVNDAPVDPWLFVTYMGYGAPTDHTSGTGCFAAIDDSETPIANPSNLLTPPLNISGLTAPNLSFWYWIGSYTLPSTMEIDIYDGTTWHNSVQSLTQNGAWQQIQIDLSSYASTQTRVRFRAYEYSISYSYQSDICLDDVGVYDAAAVPECSSATAPLDGAINVPNAGTLNWASVASATGYRLWFGTDGGGVTDPTDIVNGVDLGNVTSYAYGPIAYDTVHYWKIVPYNGNGDATGCAIWSFTTMVDPTIRTFPYLETFENASFPPFGYAITGTRNWASYSYNSNLSAYCNFWSWSSGLYSVMTTPHIDFTSETQGILSFGWSHLYNASYPNDRLQVVITDGGSFSETLFDLTGAALNSNDGATSTTPGSFAHFEIAIPAGAFGHENSYIEFTGTSGYGPNLFVDNIQIIVDPPLCTTPVAPLDLAVDVPVDGSLTWNPVGDATGYKIWFGNDGGGTVDPTTIENGTDLGNLTSYPYTGLTYNAPYYWKIVPYNALGDAIGCAIWSFTTVGIPPCTTPISPIDTATDVAVNGNLTWDAAVGATGYKLWFGTDGAGVTDPTTIENGIDLGNVTSYAYTNLAYSAIHYWKVVPYNVVGDAVGCPIWSFTTEGDPTIVTFPYCQGFESGTFPPSGWTVTGTRSWATYDDAGNTRAYCAFYNWSSGYSTLTSPHINFGTVYAAYLTFRWSHLYSASYPDDQLDVVITDGTWSETIFSKTAAELESNDGAGNTTPGTFTEFTVMIPPNALGHANSYLEFTGTSGYGPNLYIDDICLYITPIVINEVAWSGTVASFEDEWIELYNTSAVDVDIAGWSIYGADTGVIINFADAEGSVSTVVPAKGYLVYTDSNAVFSADAPMDIWDSSIGLNNTSPGQLILYNGPNGTGSVVDIAEDNADDWCAGEATNRISMERINPAFVGTDCANWIDNDGVTINGIDAAANPVIGTPGQLNSQPMTITVEKVGNDIQISWTPVDGQDLYETNTKLPYGFGFDRMVDNATSPVVITDGVIDGLDYFFIIR
ncbi:choice-of-anchor D domain-containing protein [bacterium]|nr:choice-of-anchor D domain-containing protein [bacterium]